jgi:hypothetical protein
MTQDTNPIPLTAGVPAAFDDISQLGPSEVGPAPRTKFCRWARVPQVDLTTLPPTKTYTALRTPKPITIDGTLSDPVWARANWSAPFGKMHDGSPTPYETRIALLWDETHLYAGYKVEDPDIRAVMSDFNDHIYFKDEDVELFIDGGTNYYEIGLNAINTSYQIRWTWVQKLVEQQRFADLEELFKAPDYLYYVARDGEKMGRHADLNYQLKNIRHAVHIDGTLNFPAVKDKGWTVTMALTWESIKHICMAQPLPPKPGDNLRMTAYRCHHDREKRTAKGWTWSIQGNDNIHIPERWNTITFSDKPA